MRPHPPGMGRRCLGRVRDELSLEFRREHEVSVALIFGSERGKDVAAYPKVWLPLCDVLLRLRKRERDAAEVGGGAHTASRAGFMRVRRSVDMTEVAARSAVTLVVVMKMSGTLMTAR